MKNILKKISSIFVIILIIACIAVSIPAIIRMVKDISATPDPNISLTLDQACDYYDKVVEVEGRLELPREMECTTEKPIKCKVELFDPYWREMVQLVIPVHTGSGTPPVNHMPNLNEDYTRGDFYLVTADKRLARDGSFISVTGRENKNGYCIIDEIERVEVLDRLVIDVGSELRTLTLQEAITEGVVIATITGSGLFQVDITLKPKVDANFEIIIEPGTMLISTSEGVQNMVVREEQIVYLEPDLEIGLELEVSCANMHLDQPSYANLFTVSPEPALGDLRKLLGLDDFTFLDLVIQQFAIWTITDNPVLPSDYVGIERDGYTHFPEEQEIENLKNLFQEAEIDISIYGIFNYQFD